MSDPTHNCKGQAAMNPRVGLPLGNKGVSAVASAEELLSSKAKGAKHRESKRHKVESVTSTHLRVLVPLRLLDNIKSRAASCQPPVLERL